MTTTPAPTDLDLDTLKTLLDAMPEGPWRVAQSLPNPGIRTAAGWEVVHASYDDHLSVLEFIAAARNALPALLDELAKTRTRLGELDAAITWHTTCLSCSATLTGAYEETVRAETAERELAKTHAELAGRIAWLYRNSTRMTQMRYDAATAAGYDFTQYAAVMEQPVERDALIAYLREEIAFAEREIAAIDANPATTAEPAACICATWREETPFGPQTITGPDATCPVHGEKAEPADECDGESLPGTFWERSVIERFINGTYPNIDNVRLQVSAMLAELRPGPRPVAPADSERTRHEAEPADEPSVAVGGDEIGNRVMAVLKSMTPREISDRIRSQPCPTCGVPVGEQCRSQNGPRAASHVERLRIFTEAMRAQVVAEPADEPKATNKTCGYAFVGNVGEFTCDLYAPHNGKQHWNSLAEFAWTDERAA